MKEDWRKVEILYDSKANQIVFPIHTSKILPTFLHYLLEYHNLPQNAKLVFLDKTVRLKKTKESYEYEEV